MNLEIICGFIIYKFIKYHINPKHVLDLNLFDLPPHLDLQTLSANVFIQSFPVTLREKYEKNLLKLALRRSPSRWTVHLLGDAGLQY